MEDENELIAKALADEFAKQDEKAEFLDNDNDDDDDDDDDIGLVGRLRKSNYNTELQISPEDLIWADTCLVPDLEMSDELWTSLKEDLLDSITAFAPSYEQMQVDNVGVEEDDHAKDGGEEGVESQEHFGSLKSVFKEWDIRVLEEEGDDEISYELNKKVGEIESSENVFKVWDLRVSGEEDDDETPSELSKKVREIELSENAFKVWDLCVVEEEYNDELLTELNEAIAVLNIRGEQKLSADGGIPTVDEELEDLVANVGDLSLKTNSKNIGEKSFGFQCR